MQSITPVLSNFNYQEYITSITRNKEGLNPVNQYELSPSEITHKLSIHTEIILFENYSIVF